MARFPADPSSSPGFYRLAAACGFLGSTLPIAMVLAAASMSEWFSWSRNALSELGVGSQALLFNSAMWVGGLLNTIFTLGLYLRFRADRLKRSGAILLIASSICMALTGVFTVERPLLHAVAALGFFIPAPIGFLLISFGAVDIKVRRLGLICGVSALLSILVLPIVLLVMPFEVGFAVPEIAEALFISAWAIYMAARLYRGSL